LVPSATRKTDRRRYTYIEMSKNVSTQFIEGLQQLGLINQESVDGEPTSPLYTQFLRYRQELLDWNTRTNLTAITNPDDVLIKHFLDSLSLLQAYDRRDGEIQRTVDPLRRTGSAQGTIPTTPVRSRPMRLLDIGSGAGFPGLPLKIVHPDWHVTLLEATGKKTAFLQHIVEVLGLEHVDIVHGRAEELAHNKQYRAAFDIVTARAVSSLPTLLEYCAPYCRIGGYILLPKKGDLAQELEQGRRAAALVGASLQADVPVNLPGLNDGRCVLVWQQRKACPAIYPRSGAAMAKKPIQQTSRI
jgi:16S rRNA (guanine527-N7)-methyltransferase